MMWDEDDQKKLDEWFETNEHSIFTYHHTEQRDGEDAYAVGIGGLDEFFGLMGTLSPELLSIPVRIDKEGIWFTTDDLENAAYDD